MIIFHEQQEAVAPGVCLSRCFAAISALQLNGCMEHRLVVDLMIEYSEFESGVADAVSPREDADSLLLRALRQTGILAARIFILSWDARNAEIEREAARLEMALKAIESFPLPETIRLKVSEGFAYYGLYPETYLAAARNFMKDVRPESATCIGIRNIGTGLSSIIAAALEQERCRVRSFTVRPRGHPFERRLVLSAKMREDLAARSDGYFLIVDEGPGLSGSSLCSTAEELSKNGVPDDRIVFFPSWPADGSGFVSAAARERWTRHRKYVAEFEDVWVRDGRLAKSLNAEALEDISAGRWRGFLFKSPSQYPAVHPGHERRKYLCVGVPPGSGRVKSADSHLSNGRPPFRAFAKFAGLGRYGKHFPKRAEALSNAGFSPATNEGSNGFSLTDFVRGFPLGRNGVCPAFIDRVARYLAFVKRSFPAAGGVSREEMIEMIRVNTAEGLGRYWSGKLDKAIGRASRGEPGESVAIDGRVFLHEWILTPQGYVKTDSLEHHNDHFYPGCNDIAWDLAACTIEFRLDRDACRHLISSYGFYGADGEVRRRVPFFRLAYLSFRLGYAAMSAESLAHSPDGKRFQDLACYYACLLQREICRIP